MLLLPRLNEEHLWAVEDHWAAALDGLLRELGDLSFQIGCLVRDAEELMEGVPPLFLQLQVRTLDVIDAVSVVRERGFLREYGADFLLSEVRELNSLASEVEGLSQIVN